MSDEAQRPRPSGAAAPNELRALTALAFEELRGFPGAIRDMHLGIAERAFKGAGAASFPARLIHDAASRSVYGALAAATSAVGRAADTTLAARGIGEHLPLSTRRPGAALVSALGGLIGDRLERSGSDLHQPASVRVDGEAVALDAEALRAAFPRAGTRLVVFLHGLMGNEFYWDWGGESPGDTYGARLESDIGSTAVYLRYNTGLHISENGRDVAALLEQLVTAWPQPVGEIALVGHSMGGLIARSACHSGSEAGQEWTERVGHVVSLGTPHLGAPLEQGAHVVAEALHSLPETRMLGAFLRKRSAGIRDLRHGSLVDEDWRGRDPNALRAAAVKEVPLLAGATHCFVSATITRDPRHPLGRLLGDILVLAPSATGRGRTRRIPFEDEHGHHVSPAHHLSLLNHPEVYDRLRGWLAPGAKALNARASGART
jgi:pimeloyl-ACP methyl ester carboxylesterase